MIIDRLRHYFLTYKTLPGEAPNPITIDPVYGAAQAHGILTAARADYAHRLCRLRLLRGKRLRP